MRCGDEDARCGVTAMRCGNEDVRCGVTAMRCGGEDVRCGVTAMRCGGGDARCGGDATHCRTTAMTGARLSPPAISSCCESQIRSKIRHRKIFRRNSAVVSVTAT